MAVLGASTLPRHVAEGFPAFFAAARVVCELQRYLGT